MSGKKSVDKVAKGLGSLIDDFTAAVKEIVNAGEETVVSSGATEVFRTVGALPSASPNEAPAQL